MSRGDEALAPALETLADHVGSGEIRRCEAAIRGYAAELVADP